FTMRPPKRLGRLHAAGATSQGKVRDRNEDCLLVQQTTWAGQAGRHDLTLLAIADGMGGHQAGGRASAITIGSISRALGPGLSGLVAGDEALPLAEALLDAVDFALWEAHRAIARAAAEGPDTTGMGATAVVALILDGIGAICHVGDCRAYHLQGGVL